MRLSEQAKCFWEAVKLSQIHLLDPLKIIMKTIYIERYITVSATLIIFYYLFGCCICKSSLDPLAKMNFEASVSYVGLCLTFPPARWQAANPPLSYQLLLKSRLSFHQTQPLDANELGIFRAVLSWVVVHKIKKIIPQVHIVFLRTNQISIGLFRIKPHPMFKTLRVSSTNDTGINCVNCFALSYFSL